MKNSDHNQKPARLRQSAAFRAFVRETNLSAGNLVMPLFFKEGRSAEPIPSMPGIKKMPKDMLVREAVRLEQLGIKSILVFGSGTKKDAEGTSSYDEKSPFHDALRAIKKQGNILLITDVCLCAYTDHGHCGVVEKKVPGSKAAHIDNKRTLEVLAKVALSHAKAGADIVAPSGMTDGQVKAIREALDKEKKETAIMSYSAKYASAFYGPFRSIYDSSPVFGDRRTYQMDPANKEEALREAVLDVHEGADIVMVKPALAYLDVISAVRAKVHVPVAAYNVSGEYSMVKAAAQKKWLNEKTAVLEIMRSIKRAGADIIITYWAGEAAGWIKSLE
ncbi:MAG: porphobilinogen synthase [Candidatus Omnitrophica bacterium]|nr:porphobilinogen synthase [Candidatus Omnitrophota bacterium]